MAAQSVQELSSSRQELRAHLSRARSQAGRVAPGLPLCKDSQSEHFDLQPGYLEKRYLINFRQVRVIALQSAGQVGCGLTRQIFTPNKRAIKALSFSGAFQLTSAFDHHRCPHRLIATNAFVTRVNFVVYKGCVVIDAAFHTTNCVFDAPSVVFTGSARGGQ